MNKKILILCLAGIMSISLAGCKSDSGGFGGLDDFKNQATGTAIPNNDLDRGIKLYREKKYQESMEMISNWIKNNPKDQQGYVALASVMLAVDSVDDAKEILALGLENADMTDTINDMLADLENDNNSTSDSQDTTNVEKILKLQTEYSPDGKVISTVEIVFDEMGNKISVIQYDKDGNLMGAYKQEFDSNNNMIEKTHFDAQNNVTAVLTRTFNENNKLIAESKTDDFEAKYEYDSNGNCSVKYFSRWGLDSKYTYNYDSENRKTVEKFYDSVNAKKPLTITNYEYDEKGNLIKESNAITYIKREYNSNGDIVIQSTHTYDGALDAGSIVTYWEYDDKGREIKESEFDAKGNLVRYFIYEYNG